MVEIKGPQFNNFNNKSVQPSQSLVNSASADDVDFCDIQLETKVFEDVRNSHQLEGTTQTDCGCVGTVYTACTICGGF